MNLGSEKGQDFFLSEKEYPNRIKWMFAHELGKKMLAWCITMEVNVLILNNTGHPS
jgi:hypothetical protein